MKYTHLILATILLSPTVATRAADAPNAAKPNIIFILADDLGIGNVSCYGADNFKTPNLDSLAHNGLRFNHCYAAPICGPTRTLLMTGRYAFHTGMTGNQPGRFLKPDKEVMMPRVLKTAGYVTAQCGKWAQLPLQPGDWGFDEYLRFHGSGIYWNYQEAGKTYTLNGKEVHLRDGEYMPDRMHEFVVDFIARHRDQPFYIYYSMSHVHRDILPTPDTARGTKDKFILFQDNVAYMDKLVGKLVAELDRLKLRKNTLIVFAGDNGTAGPFAERSTINGGKALSGHKATMLECGSLVPCIASWPGKIPENKVTPGLINICDFYPTFSKLAGANLPAGLAIDGRDFAPQLCGQSSAWPRDWIFVQLENKWHVRDMDWKLDESHNLFDMRNAPYTEPLVPGDTTDAGAVAARKKLQAVLDKLAPVEGIPDRDPAKQVKGQERKGKTSPVIQPGNLNEEGE